jgi:hypothetical protein
VYENLRATWTEALSTLPRLRSFSYNFLIALFRVSSGCHVTYSDMTPQIYSGLLRQPTGTSRVMYFWYPGRPLGRKDTNSLEKISGIIAEASNLSRAQGAHFLLAFAPTKFRVYQGLIDFPADSEALNWTVNDLPQRLGQKVKEIGAMSYIDLTPALRQAAEAGRIVYFPDDTHWNEEGHRLAAQAIDNVLRQPIAQKIHGAAFSQSN